MGFLDKAIVGVVGVGKEAQVSLRGHKLMSAILFGWGRQEKLVRD